MFKKTMLFVAALAMIVQLAGCACTGTNTPQPTPSLAPAATPSAGVLESTPDAQAGTGADNGGAAAGTTGGTDISGTGDAAGTGDGTNATGNGTNAAGNGTSGGATGGAGASTASIENFREGTEMQEADVPQIASAVKAKYENATIKSIKHAMRENKQVYEVEVASGSTTQTVYVQPDGTVME